jgi:glycine dehydrogenase subunit 1
MEHKAKRSVATGVLQAKPFVHPYIPNSVPEIKESMLREIGVESAEELYADIPKKFVMKRRLDLPKPSPEFEVRKRVMALLSKNKSFYEMPSFLGAGCWPHYVPAVCDEIVGRAEFLTSYAGNEYVDLGRFQALFEFQSMIGELVGLDAVSWPLYDWASICGEAVRMASRITGRQEILVPRTINPERLSVMKNYSQSLLDVKLVNYDRDTGQLDVEDLKNKISSSTAAVYIENPSYLGFIEAQGDQISDIAHDHGALSIVGVEPLSLGVLAAPGGYGADIVVGEGQPLGVHMNYGGGVMGILACRDEERFVAEMPNLLLTITTTQDKTGEQYGFNWWALPKRLHYESREKGKSFTGTNAALWGIGAAVFMALLGPQGIRELGETIMQKAHYAMKLLSDIRSIKTPLFDSAHFEEFTINFDGTGKTVRNVNNALLKGGIQGGKDLTTEFPELGKTALYCVTEVHSKDQIDKLATSLKKIVRGKR